MEIIKEAIIDLYGDVVNTNRDLLGFSTVCRNFERRQNKINRRFAINSLITATCVFAIVKYIGEQNEKIEKLEKKISLLENKE